jgi:hypothetical protein
MSGSARRRNVIKQTSPETLLDTYHAERHPVAARVLRLGEPGGFNISPWADRVQLIDAKYAGTWELPVFGAVTAPAAVLIRPDGYVAWAGDLPSRDSLVR